MIARDTFNELVNDSVSFKVTLTCSSTGIKATYDSKTQTQISFTIKQEYVSIPIPYYESTPKGCTAEQILISLQT